MEYRETSLYSIYIAKEEVMATGMGKSPITKLADTLMTKKTRHKLYAKCREKQLTTKSEIVKKVCGVVIEELNLDGKKF